MKYFFWLVALCFSATLTHATYDAGIGPALPPLPSIKAAGPVHNITPLPGVLTAPAEARLVTSDEHLLPPLVTYSTAPRLIPDFEMLDSSGRIVPGNLVSVAPASSPLFPAPADPLPPMRAQPPAVAAAPQNVWQLGSTVAREAQEALNDNAKAAVFYNKLGARGCFIVDHGLTALSFLLQGGVFVCAQTGHTGPIVYLVVGSALAQSGQIFAASRRAAMERSNLEMASAPRSSGRPPAAGAALVTGTPAPGIQP